MYFPLNYYAVHLKLLLKNKAFKKNATYNFAHGTHADGSNIQSNDEVCLHKVQEMKTAWLVHQEWLVVPRGDGTNGRVRGNNAQGKY